MIRGVRNRDRESCQRIATGIDAFVDGRGGPWDWDDFISVKHLDPLIESVRLRCIRVRDDFPPTEDKNYCSAAGIEVLRSLAAELREHTGPDLEYGHA